MLNVLQSGLSVSTNVGGSCATLYLGSPRLSRSVFEVTQSDRDSQLDIGAPHYPRAAAAFPLGPVVFPDAQT